MPPGPSTLTKPCTAIQARRESAQLGHPADERIALGWEVLANIADRTPELADADNAVSLVHIFRRREGSGVGHPQFEDLDRFLDTLEPVVAVTLGLRPLGKRLADGLPGVGSKQRLTAAGQRHDARSDRHGEAVDLRTYRSPCDIFRSVLAEAHGADMKTRSSGEPEFS